MIYKVINTEGVHPYHSTNSPCECQRRGPDFLYGFVATQFLVPDSIKSKRGGTMRWLITVVTSLVSVGFSLSFVLANPAMIPDHPGYQMGAAKDPVVGMALANDPGQAPLSREQGLREAAAYHDKDAAQDVTTYPSLEFQGAGLLPKTKGYPDYKIEPPVTEAINPNK